MRLFIIANLWDHTTFLSTVHICCYSVAKLCPTLWDPMDCSMQASLSFPISRSLLRLMSIESVMPSNHLILCCPLLLLPSIFPSFGVFSRESVVPIRWPKYWNFSFSICLSSEYSGLISFRIDWFDRLVLQGINSFTFYENSSIIIPILQMRKQRHGGVKELTQDHTASKLKSWGLNLRSLLQSLCS